jgi:predicted nucleic acid-binding protein
MRVVADTSPLIALEQIGQLDLLRHLYRIVWIPPAVRHELVQGSRRLPDRPPWPRCHWIRTAGRSPRISGHLLRAGLGPGESEALALAAQ